jgi:hypothetical protein
VYAAAATPEHSIAVHTMRQRQSTGKLLGDILTTSGKAVDILIYIYAQQSFELGKQGCALACQGAHNQVKASAVMPADAHPPL